MMDFEQTLEWLERCGVGIGVAAADGDKKADEIIKFYRLYYAAPRDPGAQGLLMAACNDYRNQQTREG